VRKALVAEARRAFNDKGFGAVSVEELCEAVGVAKGTFYRFFGSKQEVFLAAVASVADVVGAAAASGDRRRSGWFDEAVGPYVPLLLEASVRALHGDTDAASATAQVIDRLVAVASPRRPRDKRGAGAGPDPTAGRRRLANAVQQQIEAGIRSVLALRRALPTQRA
jgi:AcrR family transcriptional regulator